MGISKVLSSIPVFGGLFDDSDDKAREQLEKNRELYEGIDLPNIDWSNFTPEQFRSSGEYAPEMVQAQQLSEDPAVKSAQLSALMKMAGLSETGLSAVDEAGFNKARQLGQQVAKSASDAAIQNAEARGVAGGGLEFAMREIGNQGGAERSQQAALDQAAEAAKQRALYTQAYSQGLGNMRDQDYRTAANNNELINRFNQLNTTNRNQAQQYNLNASQNVMNANVQGRNQAQQYNLEGRRGAAQQGYDNQLKRASGIAGGNTDMAKSYYAEGAANQANRNALTGAAGSLLAGSLFGDKKKGDSPAASSGGDSSSGYSLGNWKF